MSLTNDQPKGYKMKLYETVFIARQDLTSSQVESLVHEYVGVIKTQGGEITKTELCGLRPLAYKIKKNSKGHYALLNIKAPSSAVQEVERLMRINENILRYLTVQVDAHDINPSPLMQQKNFREERIIAQTEMDQPSSENTVMDKAEDHSVSSRPSANRNRSQEEGDE